MAGLRTGGAAILAAAALAATALFAPPGGTREAHACSLVGFPAALPGFVRDARLPIVVGTFEQAAADGTIRLRVAEGLRGAAAGEALEMNNLELGLGAGCEVYLPARRVERFSPGETVFAVLEPDDTGVAEWRPALAGYAITSLDADGRFILNDVIRGVPLDQARQQVRVAAAPPYDPGLERVRPCQPAPGVAGRLALAGGYAQAVVIGTLQPGTGGSGGTIVVEEVLKGDVGGTLAVNIGPIGRDYEETCQTLMREGPPQWPTGGQRVLAFLVPDEFGVADWRPTGWGSGILYVDDGLVSSFERYPGVDLVRELLGVAAPVPTTGAGATAPPTETTTADALPRVRVTSPGAPADNSRSFGLTAAAVVAVLVLAVGLGGYWARRRMSR